MRARILIAVLILFVAISSCSKKDNPVVTVSRKDLLCSVTWKYAQYYTNYNQANTILAYSIFKENNSKDLSKYRIKYNTDGTYNETDETGAKKTGTYKVNADETLIDLTSNNTTTTIRFGIIDVKNFQWTTMDISILGVMIPE